MFCAILPMTPIMALAIFSQIPSQDIVTPGRVADLVTDNNSTDTPLRSLEAERWDLLQIKAPEAWDISTAGKDVVVAVLDTGIDAAHPALKDKIVDSVSFVSGTGIDTIHGHGTAIAGLIAATFENQGISGIAYNAKLLDVKVAGNDGITDALKVAKGIIWAVDHGANVINISIVIPTSYPLLEYAVSYAWEKGCLIVAAAGNNGTTVPQYPADYDNVIAVAATDKNDALARWSSRGDWVDVAAPGVDILSTLPGDQYGLKNGSSFSAALVSGEAALLYANTADTNANGRINDEVSQIILENADQGDNLDFPQGRINIYDAAKAADIIRDMLPKD
jgi:thermitase